MTEPKATAPSRKLAATREAEMRGGWEAHEAKQAAQMENMMRLRAMRLARDAEQVPVAPAPSRRKKAG